MRRVHWARERGSGAGLRPLWGRLAEPETEQPAWRETPPLAGEGAGGLLSPDWWTEGTYHRRLPPPEPFASSHSLAIEQPLDFHLLWRENNPLLPLIGFVLVEG